MRIGGERRAQPESIKHDYVFSQKHYSKFTNIAVLQVTRNHVAENDENAWAEN